MTCPRGGARLDVLGFVTLLLSSLPLALPVTTLVLLSTILRGFLVGLIGAMSALVWAGRCCTAAGAGVDALPCVGTPCDTTGDGVSLVTSETELQRRLHVVEQCCSIVMTS